MPSGEFPPLMNPPQMIPSEVTKNTRFSLEVLVMVVAGAIWLGGLSYTGYALAESVKGLEAKVEKRGEASEGRIQKMEQFVAGQAELNKSQAAANLQNEKAHEKIDGKLDTVLSRLPRQ